MKKYRRLMTLGILLILFGFLSLNNTKSINDNKTSATISQNNEVELHGLYEVEYVKDGDTIVCKINGESITVRMIGIDTPESVHSDENKNCAEGEEASRFTTQMLTGTCVYLEYDEDMYDDYNRLLAYVYLEDKSMYNSMLIEKGYAKTMTIKPNTKYADYFDELQQTASKNNTGFWNGYYD